MYATLKKQLEKTTRTLEDVEKNIRKIRELDYNQVAATAGGNGTFKRKDNFPGKKSFKRKRPFQNKFGNQPPVKQDEEEEEIDEDSPNKDPVKKPTLQSTVVAVKQDVKSREDKLKEQKLNSRCFARNRRMFGVVLGTLQKFRTEESSRRIQAEQREKIDKRLKEAAEKEKELMEKANEQMFITRREKKKQIRCLGKKMEIAEQHEVWERNRKLSLNFIKTETKPSLMFLPAKHNIKTLKALKKSKAKTNALITERRAKIEQEFNELDKRYSKDDYNKTDVGEKENMMHGEVTSKSDHSQDHTIDVEGPEEQRSSIETNTEEATTEKTEETGTNDQTDISLNLLANKDDFEPIYD